MPEIYILRHGDAEKRRAGLADADRALTPKGKRDLRRVIRAAKAGMDAPLLVLSSPLRRARETAALVVAVYPGCPLVVTDRLKPAGDPKSLWKEACNDAQRSRVVLIGHEPQLGHLVAFLLESPVAVDFKKGGLIRIDTPERLGPPRGVLKWMLTPKLARAN